MTGQVFQPGQDYVAWTKHVVDEVAVDAELVFVGYGAVAPRVRLGRLQKRRTSPGRSCCFSSMIPPLDDVFGGTGHDLLRPVDLQARDRGAS